MRETRTYGPARGGRLATAVPTANLDPQQPSTDAQQPALHRARSAASRRHPPSEPYAHLGAYRCPPVPSIHVDVTQA